MEPIRQATAATQASEQSGTARFITLYKSAEDLSEGAVNMIKNCYANDLSMAVIVRKAGSRADITKQLILADVYAVVCGLIRDGKLTERSHQPDELPARDFPVVWAIWKKGLTGFITTGLLQRARVNPKLARKVMRGMDKRYSSTQASQRPINMAEETGEEVTRSHLEPVQPVIRTEDQIIREFLEKNGTVSEDGKTITINRNAIMSEDYKKGLVVIPPPGSKDSSVDSTDDPTDPLYIPEIIPAPASEDDLINELNKMAEEANTLVIGEPAVTGTNNEFDS